MKKLFVFTFGLLLFVCRVSASDTIIVHKDSRLDIFTEKQASVNKVAKKMSRTGLVSGYRLQVLNTRSRDEAFKTKARLLQSFPEQKSYVLFQSPYFKVRIGNFISRGDANDFKDLLSSFFDQPTYIIQDMVEYYPNPDTDFFNE